MCLSAKVIAIVLSAIEIVVATVTSMFSGLVWIVRRMDAMEQRLIVRIETGDARLEARIDKVDARLDRLDAHVAGVDREVTNIKAAIARWKSPYPRFILSW